MCSSVAYKLKIEVEMKRHAYMISDSSGKTEEHLVYLLAYLRAMYLTYQTAHWQVTGDPAYGNHLLFQRLYESVQEEVDTLAEKIVGYFGPQAVNVNKQGAEISRIVDVFSKHKDPHQRGLFVEGQLQKILSFVYGSIKKRGTMTLGLDDFLMATANAHETNTYLLQQVLDKGSTVRLANQSMTAEPYFFDNPERREVRDFAQSRAVTNVPSIANVAGVGADLSQKEIREDVARATIAPPTPIDIQSMPGADQFSTLNRYLVQTEQPTDLGVPQNHADVPKHRRIDPSADDIVGPNGELIDPSGDDDLEDLTKSASLRVWTFVP